MTSSSDMTMIQLFGSWGCVFRLLAQVRPGCGSVSFGCVWVASRLLDMGSWECHSLSTALCDFRFLCASFHVKSVETFSHGGSR